MTQESEHLDKNTMKRMVMILTVFKIIVVLLLAGVVTYMTNNFQYFEEIEPTVEYGTWHGFPLPFYFQGYHVDWSDGASAPIVKWNPLNEWNYPNLVIDYVIYAIFIGGILFLVEKGLKKLFKIEW